ncbi:MAG: DUF362 domain-containing protein [Candidatus Methanosuratincola petrocarbonis]
MDYHRIPPFHPSIEYPEYPFGKEISPHKNEVYGAIRELLYKLGLDSVNFGMKNWNPFRGIIKPGNRVLIVPNLVRHYNPQGGTDQLLTHGSVLRAAIDYVYIALNQDGKITIGCAPVQSGDFYKALEASGIKDVVDFYKKSDIEIKVADFRAKFLKKWNKYKVSEDLRTKVIDLGRDSEFAEIADQYEKFRVTNHNPREMTKYHNRNRNAYVVPEEVLDSDVIINLPKLKTHRKAGITCALKNSIGCCASKDCLPHHRKGAVEEGGDEYLYKSFRKAIITKLNEMNDIYENRFVSFLLIRLVSALIFTRHLFPFKDEFFGGSWYGNDTIPRAISDLNKIMAYADKNGELKEEKQRRLFTIVDAIIAGEGEGPLEPKPKKAGFLVAGENSVAVDLVCAKLMGFSYERIPLFKHVMRNGRFALFEHSLKDLEICFKGTIKYEQLRPISDRFIPSKGWMGHIELT